jgi:hypothetical protein
MEHPAQVAAEIGFLLDGAQYDDAQYGDAQGGDGQAPARAAAHGNSRSHQPVDALAAGN